MRIKVILFVILLNYGFCFSQSEKINIKTKPLKEANYLNADDFYLTHYLYIDMFLRENLFPEATTSDVAAVLNAVKAYVSENQNLDIEIDTPGKRNYLIKIALLKKEGKELFIVFTNWDAKDKHFEKKIDIENDSYTRWYFLNGNKMTYRKDTSEQYDLAGMSKSDLANAFLFDELESNDEKVIELLHDYLQQDNLSLSDQLMAKLIQLKYTIFKGHKGKVSEQVEYLDKTFKKNASKESLRRLKMAYNTTKFQIQLMDIMAE